MSTKHTPGIWVRDSDPGHLYVAQEFRGKPGGRICEVFENCLVDGYKQRANAQLIAAAPELLAFAQLVLRGIESGHVKAKPFLEFSDADAESIPMRSIGDAARAAIAKATGEKA